MNPSVSASWLLKGHFDFSDQDRGHSTSQVIRAELCSALGLSKNGLRIAGYPVGAAWRHIVWWREGDVDYAEAQFFAEVSNSHPVLSLGVAVEKGLENRARRPEQRMARGTWDWPRLVHNLPIVLADDVVATAAAVGGPINIRVRSRHADTESAWTTRAFSWVDGVWYDRHVGRAEPEEITEYIRGLDGEQDLWAIVHFARDLGPAEADGLAPADAAAIVWGLMGFGGDYGRDIGSNA